jgi:hypothetical protein
MLSHQARFVTVETYSRDQRIEGYVKKKLQIYVAGMSTGNN